MVKRETIEKIKRVEGRLAKGEGVKDALKAEHIAQMTWYSPRVKKLRQARAVMEGRGGVECGEAETAERPAQPDPKVKGLPEELKREIEKLRADGERLGRKLLKELL